MPTTSPLRRRCRSTFLRTIDDKLDNKSWAGFAHVNWEFVPSWTLAAGVRYTHETKDYWRTTSAFLARRCRLQPGSAGSHPAAPASRGAR